MSLHIVAPITGWQPQFAYYFWMVPLVDGQVIFGGFL